MEEIDIVNSIPLSKVSFTLNPVLWDSFSDEVKTLVENGWNEVKLLNDNKDVNPQVANIPNNSGGIYMFIAKPDLIPNTHIYLMYIGRARYTAAQNLRKRCSEYIDDKRPKVSRMISHWGSYLYIRYLPISADNVIIDKVEEELINKILPPFNHRIPDKTIQAAVNAFNM